MRLKRPFPELTARHDDFLMYALIVAAENEQPAMNQDGGCLQNCVRNHAGGKAIKFFGDALRPDFGAEQPQTHLHQPVVQVAEYYIVASSGDRVIENDGPNF